MPKLSQRVHGGAQQSNRRQGSTVESRISWPLSSYLDRGVINGDERRFPNKGTEETEHPTYCQRERFGSMLTVLLFSADNLPKLRELVTRAEEPAGTDTTFFPESRIGWYETTVAHNQHGLGIKSMFKDSTLTSKPVVT